MAMETVQAVRQAELKAAEIERDSYRQREEILLKAQQEAKQLSMTMIKQATQKAEQNLNAAQKKGEELIQAAVQRAEREATLMKEMAKSKEKAAIDLVLSNVI